DQAGAAGRSEEALLQPRAAVRLLDGAQRDGGLGALLPAKEPAEGLQVLTRATVLAPQDAALQLALARAIREHGGDLWKALAAATRAARLSADDADLAEQVRAELELLIGQ